MTLNNITAIMLIGTGNHVALPVIRALGTALPDHIALYTLSSEKEQANFPKFSRYLSSHFSLKAQSDESLIKELKIRTEQTGANILLPLDEFYVRKLSILQDRLQDFINLPPLPDLDVFNSLVYKNKLSELLESNGFPHASSYSLCKEKIKNQEDNFFPCLLKPIRGSSGYGIKDIPDSKSLLKHLKKINRNEYIVQEYIPGQDIDCSLLVIEGDIKAITIQKGLESKGFNFSTAIEFVKDQAILESAQKLMKITGYSGLAHLDYRLDARDFQPKLIDFNARFWLSLLGSKAAGVNFALLYCYAALDIRFNLPEVQKINYAMGVSAFQHYYKKMFNHSKSAPTNAFSTDLWGRLQDPAPEIARYFYSGN